METKERNVLNSLARSLAFLQSIASSASDPAFTTSDFAEDSEDGGIDDRFSQLQFASYRSTSRIDQHSSEDSGSCKPRAVFTGALGVNSPIMNACGKEEAGGHQSPDDVMAALDAIIQTNGNPSTGSVPRRQGLGSGSVTSSTARRRHTSQHEQGGGISPSRSVKHLRFSPETYQPSTASHGNVRRVALEMRHQVLGNHATSSPLFPMNGTHTSPAFSAAIAPGRTATEYTYSSPSCYHGNVSFAAETEQHAGSSQRPQLHDDTSMALEGMQQLPLPHDDTHAAWEYGVPLRGDEMHAMHGNTLDMPLTGNAQLRMSVDIMCAAVRSMAEAHMSVEDHDITRDSNDTDTHRCSICFAFQYPCIHAACLCDMAEKLALS